MSDTHIYSQNYRKIWINENGPIPVDSDGRSYEIHHINGDHTDNRLENLACLKIKKHFDVHYEQEDFAACILIAKRMELAPEEISKLSSEAAKKRVANGTHNFQDINNPSNSTYKVVNGIHPWQGDGTQQKNQQKAIVESGKHHFQTEEHSNRSNKIQESLLQQNKHNFQNADNRQKCIESVKKLAEEGKHHFQKNNPNNRKYECQETGMITNRRTFNLRAKKLGFEKWPYALVELK